MARLYSLRDKPPSDTWEIAFYGGTFSALSRTQMRDYFELIQPFLHYPHVSGIRISTRPDAINDDMLPFLKQYGVTTVELGGECFDDRVLLNIGRGHTAADYRNACKAIQSAGMQLGMHLMCGLPGQDEPSWRKTIQETCRIKPDMVRFAPAIVIKDTPLEKLYVRGRYRPQALEEAIQQCMYAYTEFFLHNIDIIRVGIALSDPEGNGAEKIVAGPWHPALRHEVESRLARLRITNELRRKTGSKLFVNPKDYSITTGEKQSNLSYWKQEIHPDVAIHPDSNQARYTFRIGQGPSFSFFRT
jgi:histone acetyltransferase (RNA polymerase elongator complex component)